MDTKNILLVGVGGQGTILVSKILSTGLMDAGYDVKMSEIHGMAQRGGSVSTQVRYGEKIYSPIIGSGQADILVSFETMETMRWLEFLKPDGVVVVNDYEIPSAPILTGKADYPQGIIEMVSDKARTKVVNAADISEKLGNMKVMNVVLLGALVKMMNLTDIDWEKAVRASVKEKFADLNVKAFNAGMEAVS
ncbi:indolepyruvate oxidoreductase subunit beta [Sedimentibacter saalensis]|jgi:indolepyruvate ferredoxin oxidoreductase beta subunit|uniref:Indolepyruvate ferredoxin oxidoreductase beta subunit n=2 Tax=root TaxID=1 RepID=A0A562JHM8_9FIRM|nr:indolepyruvate oxidoreductase subunit beta [Sedimentibacter saalensis]MEA5094619.1 indolepyruvate oxidoreductase subunit beta [Sedimentibacter saalensis]TWH82709.1 indolepyruvate ferredoxin oxidoreductase beta subunit [Sedimentibacter saalensis]